MQNPATPVAKVWLKRWAPLALPLLLSACASLSPDGGQSDVQRLTEGRTGGVSVGPMQDDSTRQASVEALLNRPLNADDAVRIALLNNHSLQVAMATLQISDADRVQAARGLNPHLSLGRLREGDTLEIERMLRFDVLGLLTLPWRAQWQGRQHELAKLQAAQQVVRVAADTRKAWVSAVAAQQTARYMDDVKEAAEASAELARRMAGVGNWSRLREARERLLLGDTLVQLARARHAALVEREKLTRLMGLWGEQTAYELSPRLPDLPAQPGDWNDLEARALRERLDLRAAQAEAAHLAASLGLTQATAAINSVELGYTRNTSYDNATGSKGVKRGWEIEFPLPLLDAGGARTVRAQAQVRQSQAQWRELAVRARSEVREAWHGYRTAWDLARHQRDELTPLHRLIQEETLLRYNGMLASVWDLLADTRAHAQGVIAAIETQRDFWLADVDLNTVTSGTSPGALAGLAAAGRSAGDSPAGH